MQTQILSITVSTAHDYLSVNLQQVDCACNGHGVSIRSQHRQMRRTMVPDVVELGVVILPVVRPRVVYLSSLLIAEIRRRHVGHKLKDIEY